MRKLNGTRDQWGERLSLLAVLVLTLAVVVWLAGNVQRNATYSFDSDEGLHAFDALRVSAHLRDGDLLGALDDSLRQSFYPPVHAWLLGIVLSLVSATRANVRLFSLALYALDVLLLYALGRWLSRKTRCPWLAGLSAALLALAAPPLWVVGSLVYLEVTGAMFVLVTFWGYWQGLAATSQGKRKWGWLVAGLAIAAAALTKYPYWLFLMPPLAVAIVVQALSQRRSGPPLQGLRALIERLALMALPSILVMLAWVVLPVTRNGLANYIAATEGLAQAAQPSFFAHLTFYLKGVWLQFGPSPLIAVGLAAAFLLSLARWRDNEVWPLALFFAWHLAGISIHGGLAPRFLITAMPALWLLGGTWAARAASAWPYWVVRLPSRGRWAAQVAAWTAVIAFALTSVVGLAKRVTLYPTLYMLSLETDTRAEELYRWTAEQTPPGPVSIGLVNDWDQMSGPALGWELTTRRAPNGAPRRADLAAVWEVHRLPETTPENMAALRDQMNAHRLNFLVAYTAPGVGIKRLQSTIAGLGGQARLLGERDFPLRWYWPDKIDDGLYNGEPLDHEQLQAAVDQLGTDRSLTVDVYAYTP